MMDNSNTKNSHIAIALAFIGLMFFAIGFALGINSFLIPVLKSNLTLPSGVAYLLLAATFVPFLLFGYPASMTIKTIGYKRTMAFSFLIFALAFVLFIFSASQRSFILFLLASFVSGTGNAFLQASVNPYVTILGPIESAAKRISIMGICNKLAWPVAPLFFSLLVADSLNVVISDLFLPFYIIVAVFVLLGIISLLAPLPDVKAVGEDDSDIDECAYAADKTSIWQFPHLLLGALTLFIYVGVETLSLSTALDYAGSIGLSNPDLYAWVPSVGMVIGYICGIVFIPKYLKQDQAMRICSVLGVIGSLLIVSLPEGISIWAIFIMALGCSLMWPALWPLAMADLGKFTKAGSGLLTMAIAGGAVIPTVFGFMKDSFGPQNAYWLALPCFLIILYYGTSGYKIRV